MNHPLKAVVWETLQIHLDCLGMFKELHYLMHYVQDSLTIWYICLNVFTH